LLQTLLKCRDAGSTLWILSGSIHEYADTPRTLRLLGAHGYRPHDCTTKQTDE
jgi:hypothetical protein